MKKPSLDIFFCVDAAFSMGFFVTLVTLLDRFSESVKPVICIADSGLEDEFLNELKSFIDDHPKNPELVIKKVDKEILNSFKGQTYYLNRNQFRTATLSRLALPVIFPESEFGVYLDCDFFIQKDFSTLLKFEDEEVELMAVQDRYIDTLGSPVELIDCELFGVDATAPYFNGGLLLMNLKHWDRESYWKKIQAISKKSRLYWEDQSLLNITFANRWKALPESWNRMIWPENKEYSFPQTDINYHFFGGQKPWSFSPLFSKGLVPKFFHTLEENQIPGLEVPHPNKPHSLWWMKNMVKTSFSKKGRVEPAKWD